MRNRLLSVLLASAFTATAAQAGVINGSFESGLTGWTSVPASGFTASILGGSSAPAAQDGTNIAQLLAGNCSRPGTTSSTCLVPTSYTTLSQLVALAIGDVVSGKAFFQSRDSDTFNDNSYVNIGGGVEEFVASVASVGNAPANSGWVSFSFTAPSAGNFLIEAGVRNGGCTQFEGQTCVRFDNAFNSELYLDAITVTPRDNGGGQAPEPGSMALFATGLLAFGLARRRKGA